MKKKPNYYWMYNQYSIENAILNLKEKLKKFNRKKIRILLQRFIKKEQCSQEKN